MRAAFILTILGSLGLAASAHAQIIVLGHGPARACWMAAEYGMGSMNEGFALCTEALNEPGHSARDRAATYTNRAVIRMRTGDYTGSLADADASIKLAPRLGESHVNRGAALLNLMKPAEALAAINLGMELGSSKMHLVYYNRAAAREILGDIRGAYEDYKASLEQKPDFALAAQQLTRFTVVRPGTSPATDRL